MYPTPQGIAENIIADFAWTLILAIATAVSAWVIRRLTKRHKLFKFFGISDPQKITVYLSKLRIEPGGAIGIDGERRSYEGTAATFREVQAANDFRERFNRLVPSLSDNPRNLLSKLLLSDLEVQIQTSPLSLHHVDRSASFITLGSPGYNIASRFVEEELRSQVSIRLGRVGDQAPKGAISTASEIPAVDRHGSPSTVDPHMFEQQEYPELTQCHYLPGGPPITGAVMPDGQGKPYLKDEADQICPAILVKGYSQPITDPIYCFIERIVGRKRSVFYVAGLTESGTAGAAYYLATKWEDLYQKYDKNGRSKPFGVILFVDPGDFREVHPLFYLDELT